MEKLKIFWSSILVILLFVTMDTSFANAEDYQIWNEKTNVDQNHDWVITFNQEIDPLTINNENIYIQYNGQAVKDIILSLSTDKKSLKIEAPQNGYKEQETYFLYIEKNVKSITGKELNKPIKMKFTIGQSNLASKLLIKVRGTETPEELWDLLDQAPYLTKIDNEYFVKHRVNDELSSEIYDLFGTETHFTYGFYLGRLSDLAYRFDPDEQMFSVLKDELISVLGAPYEDEYANNSEYFIEWRIHDEQSEYSYGPRIVLYLNEYNLTLTQVSL